MTCNCGYTTDNKHSFANHLRYGCKNDPTSPKRTTCTYSGPNHFRWIGEKASYGAKHYWIHRRYGKASKCEECGITEAPLNKQKFFQWANISGKYIRNRDDWKQLCIDCHRVFDKATKLSKEQANKIKERYANGERSKLLAIEFGVSKCTIWEIVTNRIKAYSK